MPENINKAEKIVFDELVVGLLSVFPLFYRKIIRVSSSGSRPNVHPANVEFQMLAMLNHYGTMQSSNMGRKLGISKPNVTLLVDKLLEKGYAERTPDTIDRRVINITITGKGKQFVAKRKRMVYRVMRKNLSVLSNEEIKSLASTVKVFREILSNIEEND
jgi:DNA-binding MarR family transcriptional regulator